MTNHLGVRIALFTLLACYMLALPHTHTTPSCLQVEEEDERKKDSGRAHENGASFFWSCFFLKKTLSCSCSPLYRHTGQDENLQGKVL